MAIRPHLAGIDVGCRPLGLTGAATPAIDVRGLADCLGASRKGSGVVMVLLGDQISLGRLQMTRLKTRIGLPRLLASKPTVADPLAAVDDATRYSTVEASLEHGPSGRNQSAQEAAPLRRHRDDLVG